jgi:hypothetical protein
MSAQFLKSINWQRPWLIPLLPMAQPILQSADWRQALNAAASSLQNHRGLPIRFVPQTDLPPKTSYEAYISDTGQVPTRDNLHDFFNAMVWLTFPKIKAQLNALQAAEIARISSSPANAPSPGSDRGKTRDAATIFDENAALVITRSARLTEALRNHEWRHLFITGRKAFLHDCEVQLFGHALMEKLVSPYKAITAHAWIVDADNSFFVMDPAEKQSWIDERVSRQLELGLSTAAFTPLPILGLPGWWQDQEENFYEDANVFRSKKIRKNKRGLAV